MTAVTASQLGDYSLTGDRGLPHKNCKWFWESTMCRPPAQGPAVHRSAVSVLCSLSTLAYGSLTRVDCLAGAYRKTGI